jgi:hypothetical protein
MADALCDLVRKVWEEMKLAGEAGSLLKIEKSLAEAIAKGREEWDEKMPLFRVETFRMMEEKPKVNYVKMNVDFWMQAEALVLVALDEYAAQAENGSYHRRLFAEDATRGFAFIDLCRKYYDILLMNPPFGELSKNSKSVVEKIYPSSKGNILAHFIERAADLITAGGKNGVIVSRACFFLTSMSEFRSSILGRCLFVNFFADLGSGVLDAMVETAAVVLSNDKKEYNEAIFFRHLIDEQKDVGLLNSVNILKVAASSRNIFLISPQNFSALSGTPYVYWVTPNIIQNIANHYKLEPHGGMIRVGLQTGDDHRYLRLWLEVDQNKILNAPDTTGANQMRNICLNATMQGKIWTWYSKIDEASPFAASIHLVVNWYKDGREIKAAHVQNGDSISRYVRSEDSYFKPGISYMLRSSRLIPYVVPRGVIPTAGRSQIYPKDGQENWILALSASNMGSAVARFRGESFERPKLQNSMVASVPFVEQPLELKMLINKCLADKLYLQRRNFVADETCIEFINIPRSLIFPEPTPLERSSLLGREIDLQISAAFGLDEIAMATLERDLIDSANVATTLDKQNNDLYLQDDNTDRNNSTDYDSYSAVISYAIGCAFGRWDIEYSTGKKVPLELQDPFTSLPICSPGMLQNAHGLPAIQSDMATDYPIYICWLGVLVDDSSHSEDIEHHIRKVFNVIWPDRTDAIEQEACEILGVSSLRAYFANPTRFFDDHLKRYSKSRRVAPIYWPLSTPSSSYTLWLYYHRLTDQTLYSCVNDFVEPKLKQANEDVDMLRRRANRSRQEEKELTRLSDLALELAAFRDELLRIARFWQPNLNDGVQITAAPLWRLFQHRAWQKRLKETWEALEAGDYDWAHLAYSIWPERVREKCKTDKSLAIAHDLEHLYVEPVKTVKAKKGGRKPQSVDDDEQGELL